VIHRVDYIQAEPRSAVIGGRGGARMLASLRRAESSDLPKLIALQRAAYAGNRTIIGREPLPLMADYELLSRDHEIWLLDEATRLLAALILQPRPDDLLIWSVAVSPEARGRGLANRLLDAAEDRARELDRTVLRLYTAEKLVSNVAWYARHGYSVEKIEALSDRRLVHMIRTIA
jgi:ribosomal protein S18 acetylase RimI-like enzyme